MSQMKQRSWIVLRPVCFFVFLIVVVLSLAALLITIWFIKVARIEKEVKLIAHNMNQEFISGIQNAAALFSPNNASAINLARVLSFSLDDNDLHFPNLESKMPVMDGSAATERIREVESGYGVRTPIVALTAHNKGQEIDNMMKAGVDGYIAKPLNKDNFFKIMSQLDS